MARLLHRIVSGFQERDRTCKLPVSEGLELENGVAYLTYILLVRHLQRPDSRRGDIEGENTTSAWEGCQRNLGPCLKMGTLIFKFEVHYVNSLI